jgi:hypothetical protein
MTIVIYDRHIFIEQGTSLFLYKLHHIMTFVSVDPLWRVASRSHLKINDNFINAGQRQTL